MIGNDEIRWTGNVGAPGAGTQYLGTFSGEVLYVVRSEGSGHARRFRAFRFTSAGVGAREHPVRDGGVLSKVWHAKEECAYELDAMSEQERETLIGNLRERRELLKTLRLLGRDERGLSLPELRDAVAALRPAGETLAINGVTAATHAVDGAGRVVSHADREIEL